MKWDAVFPKNGSQGEHVQANKMAPRMDPWGTPHRRGAEEETISPRRTENVLSVRKDLNHFNAMPIITTTCSRRETRMLWFMVSKVVVRSNIIKQHDHESVASSKTLKTFTRAVSVLCRDLIPD